MAETRIDLRTDHRPFMTRRAYRLGVLNGIVFNMGSAFVDASTVLPAFVSQLTTSKIAVGLISAIGAGGWYLPQLLAANHARSRPHQRPMYILTTVVRAAGWVTVIPIAFLLGERHALLALLGFFLGYSLFSFGGGLGGVAWLDIVAKTVAPNRLGSFFANREFWGALGGVACGLLVRTILASPRFPFPYDYCLLFTIALAFFIPGWIAFGLIKEPPGRVSDPLPFGRFLQQAPHCLRGHDAFRLLLWGRVLLGCTSIALPFYIVCCRQLLQLPDSAVGVYLSLQMTGAVAANPFWGRLSDRAGPHRVLAAVAVLTLATPVTALVASVLSGPPSQYLFGAVFFALGTTGGGGFIGSTNYLLGIAPEDRRALYIGVLNTLFSVTLFLPLLGGLVVRYASFPPLFASAACFALAGAVAVLRLPPCDRGVEA